MRGLQILSKFTITQNPITVIKRRTFQNHNIENIDLGWNNIKIIENECFVNLTKLENILLDNNMIQHLNPETFLNLSNVDALNLLCNKIEAIGRSSFEFFQKSEADIDLNGNCISAVDVRAFENFITTDAYIALRNNSIQILSHGIFDNHMFKDIDLTFNKIHTIPKDLFRNNCTFGILSLHNNFLSQDTIVEILKLVNRNVGFLPQFQGSGGESNNDAALTIIFFGLF